MLGAIVLVAVCVLLVVSFIAYLWRGVETRYESTDAMLGTLGALFLGGLTMLGLLAGYDGIVQSTRAFAKIIVCEAAQGVPRRQLFTTNVVCVKSITRQDTTTVNLKVQP